jgi:hypothetical protein
MEKKLREKNIEAEARKTDAETRERRARELN